MLSSKEIHDKYINFFKERGHKEIPNVPLVPENDSTLLFVNAGMFPLVPYLLGEIHPHGNRLVNIQRCIRTVDIDEVGDATHCTFFQMIGNWSLGDYFKEEQLTWYFDFLISEMKLDPNKIFVTVHGGEHDFGISKDEEAANIWKKLFATVGIDAQTIDLMDTNLSEEERAKGKIFYSPSSENWWSRAGVPQNMPIGEPGGPDSELYYELSEEPDPKYGQAFHYDSDKFVEMGNSVFMMYKKATEDSFVPLPSNNIDFGGGFERLVMICQGKKTVFETDLFEPITKKIEELATKEIADITDLYKIADHARATTFAIADGILPSNLGQGYIIRQLARRAIKIARGIGINENFMGELAKVVIDIMEFQYPYLNEKKDFILAEIEKEENQFRQTLEKGLKEFEKFASTGQISGKDAFTLFATYGFPFEITEELAQEKGMKVDRQDFDEEMKKHQELSRTASAGMFKGGLADSSEETTKLHTAAHLMLEALRRVLGPHVQQKGSNITAERLRFDFSHGDKMTDEQKAEVEKIVNEQIQANLPVSFEEMSVEEAKALGATGVFDDRYGDKVKVYSVGTPGEEFSKEICGGPHISNTGELGKFHIKKEESSSAGVRRIKAILE